MIVLISPETDILNEIETLHLLFDAGLQYYHLRKPSKNEEEINIYLNSIDEKYHKNIVIHQFHHLAKIYDLKGVHLQEQFRIDLGTELHMYIDTCKMKSRDFTVSSSFHQPNKIKECQGAFDYYLLSPVFNSISKAGYKGKDFDVNDIDKKIIGMGGITAINLAKVKAKGFQGAGVLGGVWCAENPLKAFIEFKDKQVF